MTDPRPPLAPLEVLAGKQLLLTGTTGFLAKVMLSMLLERFSVGKIYCLIRSQPSKTARQRFFDEVVASEMMEPLKKHFGGAFSAYLAEKVEVLAGDISEPDLGLDAETVARLHRDLDAVINSAGLVTFNPPLDNALEINTVGARNVAAFTAGCQRPHLVHISTCFVVGNRSGHIREDTPIAGYFPKQIDMPGVEFKWERELKDLERAIAETRGRTDDAALESRFRTEAIERLKQDGRELQDCTLRAAVTNQRRRWVAEELIRIGLSRAAHWGWPNIYTYTKALGEQAIATQAGLKWAIVRPAIVESSIEYPIRGWNEGMNTSAPLAYMGIHGQVAYPTGDDLILDVIPVDYVSSATLAATAALLAGESSKVYQAATGDVNPATAARVVTLVGLYKRRRVHQDEDEGKISWLKARFGERTEPIPMPRERYDRIGAPAWRRFAESARKVLDGMEPERYGPFGGLVSDARKLVKDAEQNLAKVTDAFELFMPFIYENRYVFRTTNTRSLFERMNDADRALLPYHPETLDWREYWLDVHLPGLEHWVFPKLEVIGPKRVPIPRTYRDLAEMFQSRTEQNARRVAFRILRKDDVADDFTYRDVRRAAEAVADFLIASGVKKGERVMLASESRPEWGMSYFGILLAGATAVPIDVDLTPAEMANIARASQAVGVIASDKIKATLVAANGNAPINAPLWSFDTVFVHAEEEHHPAPRPTRSPEDIASIIFTSGTTGTPKGVMLTDRNFTGLTARVSALFELNRHDSLLSVLPLHHTFEFSTGLLMPLAAGASVTYLEERTSDLLSRAFRETPVTAIVGVPAVWESLHRKMSTEVTNKGKVVEAAIRGLMQLNRALRDKSPWNFGRFVFAPMHEALGGRVRFMVSGGAALDPALAKDFRGMGFNLYQGYGLTEASPVISVAWPGERTPANSVGWPLPGLEVRIDAPDQGGVGEVIARGPTIMAGYLDDPTATQLAVRDGWLHTGDQGRLDDEGRLFIVGRQKDVIIDTGGKNVYPDEIEALYLGGPFIKELSVVGVPAEQGTGERVAAMVVPDYESKEAEEEGLGREQIRDRIREHFREVGAKQPLARRVKLLHFWDATLPRTSTRKIKRPYVKEQIIRLERALRAARQGGEQGTADRRAHWVRRTVAAIAQKPVEEIRAEQRLVEELGFDSLMQLELMTSIESEFPNARVSQEEMSSVETVGDVARLAARDRSGDPEQQAEVGDREERPPVHVPRPVAVMGKAALGLAQRLTYQRLFDVSVEGRGNVPANANFIVAANHSSHLDMGLVKFALDGLGGELITLAAKDYFFDDPLRRVYFENFTNLLPMDRHGSLKTSLRLASEALRGGRSLLIFPEGTRARDGIMTDFKPALGYLALNEGVDIVPIYLSGTHDALPVGAAIPKKRAIRARIGPALSADALAEETRGWPRAAAYRFVAQKAEAVVRRLAALERGEHPEDVEILLPASVLARTNGQAGHGHGAPNGEDEGDETPSADTEIDTRDQHRALLSKGEER